MAIANGISSVGPSFIQDVDGILTSVKWNGTTLTYSFPQSMSAYEYGSDPTFQPVTAQQKHAVLQVFAELSEFSLLQFQEADTDASGILRFARSANPSTAYAYYPSTSPSGGDSWYKIGTYDDPYDGTYAGFTFIHEIGHALGLKHGHETSYYGALPYERDSNEYSVMTYRSYVGAAGQYYEEQYGSGPQTYMMDDIAAIQYLYGANFNARSGDTVYRWMENSGTLTIDGQVWREPPTNTVFETIWDGGGHDTYDLSLYASAQHISLNPGDWSTASDGQLAYLDYNGHRAHGNIANAYLYQGDLRSLIETVLAGSGDDWVAGNVADNYLSGGAGNDTLIGDGTGAMRGGNDTLIGGAGNDSLDGGVGNDRLEGQDGNDTLLGGAGDDLLTGLAGADLMDGGAGNDSLYSFAGQGPDTIRGGDGIDLLQISRTNLTSNVLFSIRDLVTTLPDGTSVSGIEKLNYHGSTGADVVQGGDLNDTIYGNLGNDGLAGFWGFDSLFGEAGNDTLNGGGQNDTLDGGGGNDSLDGGGGVDFMIGGGGNDIFVVDSGLDSVTDSGGIDTILTSVTLTLGSAIENGTLTSAASLARNLTGNALANTLTGSDAANVLSGLDGNDKIYGKAGADKLIGGNGDDSLSGGLGYDELTGGAGNDRFIFASLAEIGGGDQGLPSDLVKDFVQGQDRIDLSAIDSKTATVTNEAFSFIGSAAFTAAGQLHAFANSATNRTLIEGDVDGDKIADFQLQLVGLKTMAGTDFLL